MKVFIVLLYTLIYTSCVSQNAHDSLQIVFYFPFKNVADSADLTLQVIYKNSSNRSFDVYEDLDEGNRGDRFFNINIEMEKRQGKKFVYYPTRFYTNPMLSHVNDSLRHYDLPKKKLLPLSSDTLMLNLLDIVKSLEPGEYRFKAYLRVKTIENRTPYNDPEFITPPPFDEIIYFPSKWFVFNVVKPITVTKQN
jgi:hypothetical protein